MESINMKHTPGPWKVDPCWDILGNTDDGNGMVCQITTDAVPRAEAEANARLIASAPELADLCEMVARLNPDAGEIGAGMLASIVEKARNIMAQIEGRKESK